MDQRHDKERSRACAEYIEADPGTRVEFVEPELVMNVLPYHLHRCQVRIEATKARMAAIRPRPKTINAQQAVKNTSAQYGASRL